MSIKQIALASFALAFATGAMAADKITLKTGFGTSQIQSYSWGATNTTSSGSGGGAGVGKVVLQDLQVTRAVDSQSPPLFGAVNTGLHLACVELTDGTLKITLRDVLVGSYQVAGSSGGKSPTVEQVSLSFTSFSYTVEGVTQGSAAACQ